MCWKGKNTNYQEISDFIDSHLDSEELKEFEKRLINASFMDYQVYTYRFKEKKTFYQISEAMNGMPTSYISNSLDSIFLAFQMFIT